MSDKRKKNVSAIRMSGLIENIQVHNEIPVLERIKYPIIWERMTSGYRIQDLQPSKIESAIDIIKEHYIDEEPMCKGINLSNQPDGVEEYLKMMTAWLKDTQSLAAIEEGSGIFVGVLIGRVLDKTVRTQARLVSSDSNVLFKPMESNEICKPSACQEEFIIADKESRKLKRQSRMSKKSIITTKLSMRISSAPSAAGDKAKSRASRLTNKKFSNVHKVKEISFDESAQLLAKPHMLDDERMLFENPVLMKLQRFRSRVSKNCDILTMYEVPSYYSIHVMLVIPDHRGRGIGKALLRCAMDMSRKFKCDVISGTFTSKIAQNIAHKEHFEVLQEVKLCDWYEKDEPVFTEITDLTETAAMMALRMRDPPPPEIPVPQTPPRRKSKTAHPS